MGTLEVVLDHDYAYFLHGNAIKQRLSVYASVWHARDIAKVAMGYMTKRLDGEKYLCSGAFGRSSGKKWGNGHRLAKVGYFSRGDLSSPPRYCIKAPLDEKFRGVLSNLDASMAIWMLVEVGGGIFSPIIFILNYRLERLSMPKNVAEGHQTSIWYNGIELI